MGLNIIVRDPKRVEAIVSDDVVDQGTFFIYVRFY